MFIRRTFSKIFDSIFDVLPRDINTKFVDNLKCSRILNISTKMVSFPYFLVIHKLFGLYLAKLLNDVSHTLQSAAIVDDVQGGFIKILVNLHLIKTIRVRIIQVFTSP